MRILPLSFTPAREHKHPNTLLGFLAVEFDQGSRIKVIAVREACDVRIALLFPSHPARHGNQRRIYAEPLRLIESSLSYEISAEFKVRRLQAIAVSGDHAEICANYIGAPRTVLVRPRVVPQDDDENRVALASIVLIDRTSMSIAYARERFATALAAEMSRARKRLKRRSRRITLIYGAHHEHASAPGSGGAND